MLIASAASARSLLRVCNGGAEKRNANNRTRKKSGIHATPQRSGPYGTIQNLPANPAINNTRKKMINGTMEGRFRYPDENNSEIRSAIMKTARMPIQFSFKNQTADRKPFNFELLFN